MGLSWNLQAGKLYFFRANPSTNVGHTQYRRWPYLIDQGIHTNFSPLSAALMHAFATSTFFREPLFGSASRTGPPSTAPDRKSPSIVDGITKENCTAGCSMDNAIYKRREADLVEAYTVRVGAGINDARVLSKTRAGAADFESKGIWWKSEIFRALRRVQ